MSDRILYLMRGLPACGKSHTARRLAGQTGLVLETDEFFNRPRDDGTTRYVYRDELLPAARQWNFARFERAIAEGVSPIVVDRGNGLNAETRKYARYAVDHGYRVELREPESEWWQEIRVLLKYRPTTQQILDDWAEWLAEKSRSTHRVPLETIRRWLHAWRTDLTVDDILNYDE